MTKAYDLRFSIIAISLIGSLLASPVYASEKPIKHITVAEVTSKQEATQIFMESTSQLKQKTTLDAIEMNEIHIITYSLEKAVAYFFENMLGEQQATAKKMAELVEKIHLGSENNRLEETTQNLEKYFRLADTFAREI